MLIKPRAICSTNSDLERFIVFANSLSWVIAVGVSARQTEVFTSEYISGLPLVLFIPFLAIVKSLHGLLELGLLALGLFLMRWQQGMTILDRFIVFLRKMLILNSIENQRDTIPDRSLIQTYPVDVFDKESTQAILFERLWRQPRQARHLPFVCKPKLIRTRSWNCAGHSWESLQKARDRQCDWFRVGGLLWRLTDILDNSLGKACADFCSPSFFI